jgi:hypothetical protein
MALQVPNVLESERGEELDEIGIGRCKHLPTITETALKRKRVGVLLLSFLRSVTGQPNTTHWA